MNFSRFITKFNHLATGGAWKSIVGNFLRGRITETQFFRYTASAHKMRFCGQGLIHKLCSILAYVVCTFVIKIPNGSCSGIVYTCMNFSFSLCPLSLSCASTSCNSAHFAIEFTIEKFVWHCYVQCETNFICVLFGGGSVSCWKFKAQTRFGNPKCTFLKNKRPKICVSHWKFQCKTDLRHRKNAVGKKGWAKRAVAE